MTWCMYLLRNLCTYRQTSTIEYVTLCWVIRDVDRRQLKRHTTPVSWRFKRSDIEFGDIDLHVPRTVKNCKNKIHSRKTAACCTGIWYDAAYVVSSAYCMSEEKTSMERYQVLAQYFEHLTLRERLGTVLLSEHFLALLSVKFLLGTLGMLTIHVLI